MTPVVVVPEGAQMLGQDSVVLVLGTLQEMHTQNHTNAYSKCVSLFLFLLCSLVYHDNEIVIS
jgi:hypothetical protein